MAQAPAALALAGCGGNDERSAEEALLDDSELAQAERLRRRSLDSIAPAVAIDLRLGDSVANSVGLKGQAGDKLRLYRVRWSSDRGGKGIAERHGTVTQAIWTVAAIPLQTGGSKVTVVVEGAAGNKASTSRVIEFAAPVPAPAPAPSVLAPVVESAGAASVAVRCAVGTSGSTVVSFGMPFPRGFVSDTSRVLIATAVAMRTRPTRPNSRAGTTSATAPSMGSRFARGCSASATIARRPRRPTWRA